MFTFPPARAGLAAFTADPPQNPNVIQPTVVSTSPNLNVIPQPFVRTSHSNAVNAQLENNDIRNYFVVPEGTEQDTSNISIFSSTPGKTSVATDASTATKTGEKRGRGRPRKVNVSESKEAVSEPEPKAAQMPTQTVFACVLLNANVSADVPYAHTLQDGYVIPQDLKPNLHNLENISKIAFADRGVSNAIYLFSHVKRTVTIYSTVYPFGTKGTKIVMKANSTLFIHGSWVNQVTVGF